MAKGPQELLRAARSLGRGLGRLTRGARVALAGGGIVLVAITLATCGGCGKRPPGAEGTATPRLATSLPDGAPAPITGDAGFAGQGRDYQLWKYADNGRVESLASLAVHEGAVGLVEGAEEPRLRTTAIRAMAYARGWAQLPFLARTAAGKSDDEARLALDSVLELAARPRGSEDPEDADELREGCDGLGGVARDPGRARPVRVATIRALRMLPCPPVETGKELPTDLDAK